MVDIILSEDQDNAYSVIANWLANGGCVHKDQKDPQLLTLGGFAGSGKALALNTPIPTPSGWTTMGNLKPGDEVFSDDGNVCNVIATSKIMHNHTCYQLTFSDGTKIIADKDHLWRTDECLDRWSDKPGSQKTTEQIFKTQKFRKNTNHSINACQPINTIRKKLPINPYLLGIWLGDGSKAGARITTADITIVKSFEKYYNIKKIKGNNYDWGISSRTNNNENSLLIQLRKLNLLKNKHIPILYLRSSKKQRLELLRGLMDSDGTVNKRTGMPSFCSTNKKLATDVLELIRSLGLIPYITKSLAKFNKKVISDKWIINFSSRFNVFKLIRKKQIQKTKNFRAVYGRRYITNVKKVKSVPVKCICVDAPSKMFLCSKAFIPTHNSTLTSVLAKDFKDAIRFAFCALSGRAASVLGNKLREQGIKFEDGGHYCGTIHRLIYQPIENTDGEIIFWAKKPTLDYDVIVVDEASMISEEIFRDLSSYGIDILAIGDHGQLPPIEGRFSLMKKPHLRLEKIHRQAQDNPIIHLSMIVRQTGKIPLKYNDNNYINIIKKKEYIDFLKGIYYNKQEKTPEELLASAVLCYTNATRCKLNTMIRKMIFGNYDRKPQINDLVICLKNSYNKKQPLYNGFRGYFIDPIDDTEDHFYIGKINFPAENIISKEDNICKYQFGYPKTFSSFTELENFGLEANSWKEVGLLCDFGYAITVHKFQGSQADNIVLYNERPAPVSEDNYRRWLYTAVTRSSDKLTIIL